MDEGFKALGLAHAATGDGISCDVSDSPGSGAPSPTNGQRYDGVKSSGYGRGGFGGGALRGAGSSPSSTGQAAHLTRSNMSVNWFSSPRSHAGRVATLSDRPLTCGSLHPNGTHVVLGGTDHALYEVELVSGRKTRTLYTKTHGHKEWVTCVTHAPDGRCVSGGASSPSGLDARRLSSEARLLSPAPPSTPPLPSHSTLDCSSVVGATRTRAWCAHLTRRFGC